ncbi:MAG: hypothetical protein HS120_09610 [Burkholderiales bacterium]|nr:hypothetical protein [Burkholderiales bacterium]
MSITDETRTLRQALAALAAKPEWDFLARYDLPGKKPSTLQGRAFRLVRTLLTKIRLLPPDITKYRWSSMAPLFQMLVGARGVPYDHLRFCLPACGVKKADIMVDKYRLSMY